MQVVKSLPSVGIGVLVALISGAAALGAFLGVYLLFQDLEPSSRGMEVFLASVVMMVPIAVGAVVCFLGIVGFDARGVAAFTAGALLGIFLFLLMGPVSIANDCEFDTAIPFPMYKDACD